MTVVRPSARRIGAFTLIEMILAIGIIVGLLIVAMLFYRQATELRGQILQESERCATIRLLLDRMTADLRSAVPKSGGGHEFLGDTGSLSFTRTTLVVPPTAKAGARERPSGDLMRVSFATVQGNEGTNTSVIGFDRREEPLGLPRLLDTLPPASSSTNLSFIPLGAGLDSTNRLSGPLPEPLTDLIRFAHFRYWDGAGWREGWTNATPPPGVEIVLGVDPLPADANADEYPYEQFRRVVFLPAGTALKQPEDAAEQLLSPP
jgi:type II secretory pathway pseudopilin PulG